MNYYYLILHLFLALPLDSQHVVLDLDVATVLRLFDLLLFVIKILLLFLFFHLLGTI